MHYRSVADLGDIIMQNLHKLPPNVDLVVGDPRSGLLASSLLCLALNVPMADVDGFLEGKLLKTGITRKSKSASRTLEEMRTVVVIDDSINSGKSMKKTRARLEKLSEHTNFIFCAAYGVNDKSPYVDFVFDTVPLPRMFQWNVMHHRDLENCCVDIDGVLCLDPTPKQNDDGPAYKKFLAEAVPMLTPSATIGALVTSRLEKYRGQTESWLKKHDIKYSKLYMLDVKTKEERIRLGAYSTFKADVYAKSDALLFIESEYEQAHEIAEKSGKPVLCIASQHVIPPLFNVASVRQLPLRLRVDSSRRLRFWLHQLIGEESYKRLKSFAGSGKSLVKKWLKKDMAGRLKNEAG